MNIETLRIFCSVVQLNSLSRGAAANRVTQPAASQSVDRLEEALGVRLLDRSKRPFVLTPEGRVSYEGFRRVLDRFDTVEAHVRAMRNEIGGRVRVAAIYSVGLHGMRACVQDFMQRYPKAALRLEYLHPEDVYDAVTEETADLGIVSSPECSSALEVIPLRSERMVVVCLPEHPLACNGAAPMRALQGELFVTFDRDLKIRRQIDGALRRHSVSVQVTMEFDNIETIKHAVQVGAGISILPEPTVEKEVRRGGLAAVRLRDCDLVRQIGVIRLRRRLLSPAAEKFLECLVEAQAGLNGGPSLPEVE